MEFTEKDKQRFWAKVDVRGDDECWPWTAAINANGYGSFRLQGKIQTASRIAWMITHGDIPNGPGAHGTCVLHRCDNRICQNPAHLFLGSNDDNMRDMVAKGRARTRHGEENGWARLTQAQVSYIRSHTELSSRRLGTMFGISHQHILRIRHNRAWAAGENGALATA